MLRFVRSFVGADDSVRPCPQFCCIRPYKLLCKSPGECVGALCFFRQSIYLRSCAATSFIGRAVLYRRRVVRYGKVTPVCWPQRSILVLAVMLRQNAPRVLAPLFSPFFSGKTEKNGPPEARLRYYRMSVADNPSVKTCGFATSPCTGEALGGQSRPPLQNTAES